MKATRNASIQVMFLSFLLANSSALSQGWDAAADFSSTTNPNGVWSYGYKPTATGNVFGVCEHVIPGIGWYHFTLTASPAVHGDGFHTMSFHPARLWAGYGYASCLRWTAPSNGYYRVSVGFVGASNPFYDIGQTVYVIQNGTVAYKDTILTYGREFGYTNSTGLPAGSTIDIVVANNAGVDNNQTDGYVTITPTNPPPSLLSIRVSQVELCWPTATNTWYQLQYRTTLTANQWLPLFTNWVAGDGRTHCSTDAVPVGSPQRFYQLSTTNLPPQ